MVIVYKNMGLNKLKFLRHLKIPSKENNLII
jgi:hypothetical protein